MRIGIDLDGTICEIRHDPKKYSDLKPIIGAVEKIQQLKKAGHEIVIITARHMGSTGGNSSKAVAKVGKMTLDWLEKYNIPYDEIHFGKPNTDIYIDDRCIKLDSWDKITEEELNKNAKVK